MLEYKNSSKRLLLGLILSLTFSTVYSQDNFTPKQLYNNFYNIYRYLPSNCKDANSNTSYIDALKYLYAYTYVGNEALANTIHRREVDAALKYLERVARDIDDCIDNTASVAGRRSGPQRAGSLSSIVIKKPEFNSYPQNLNAIQRRQQLEESLNYHIKRAKQLELENIQLRAAVDYHTPKIIHPLNNIVYNVYPRRIPCRWSAVPGAVTYVIEVYYKTHTNNGWVWVEKPWTTYTNITGTSHTIGFIGAQPGGWEVYAVYADGSRSPKSERGTFILRR